MFKHFLKLQWKSFFRASSVGKGMALKIIMGFFAAMMLLYLIGFGIGLFFILKKTFPDVDPLVKVCEYFIYWVLFELFFRYFMQKLPVMDIKPFLALPIKKSSITHYILGRSGVSFYNLLAIFFFVPFVTVLIVQGYAVANSLLWLVSIMGIVLFVNYLNFIINKSDKALMLLGALILAFYGLEYFDVFSIKEFSGKLFYGLYQNPILCVIPAALAVLAYFINYKFLRNKVFLDASLKGKTEKVETTDLSWTKKFGDIAPFLQLDLKLIWRNKRPKTQLWVSLGMILYGLIFYAQGDTYGLTSGMFAFVGIFMTGIFLSNFGQFIPAWDSEYYSMMMSQNIPMRKYLDSKAGLISVSVVVMFLLSIPYVYFGWQALAINFACALYNLGVNIPVILFFGSKNKKRIDLTKSAIGNMQGTGAAQFLVIIPLMGAPAIIYFLFKQFISFESAIIALSVLGIIGLFFRNKLMNIITKVYKKNKYRMIDGFKQANS